MKAALLLIAIVGAASMASALKVQGSLRDEFFQYTSAELMAPLNDVIKEIDIEKQDDLNNIAHAKTSQKMMETQEAAAKAALDKATAVKDAELAKWQKTQADLLQREKEYAANDETRAQEEGVSKTIEQDFVKLAGVGPADGTIGIMPESRLLNAGKPTDAPVAAVSFGAKQEAMEALQVSVQALASISTRPEAKELLNLIQQGRKSGKITDGEDTLLKIKKSIADERKKDTDAVEAQKKVVKAAEKVYQDADANRVAKANLHDQAVGRTSTAKAVVAHEQSEYTKAQKIRDADLATIDKAKKLIEELIKTENAHLAGPAELLQTGLFRKSAATQKIREMIVAMKQDVDDEEMMQKSILDEEELKYNVTKAHRIANETARKAQVKVFEAAEKTWRKAYGEYHGAEMALSQETAIAEQERATINSVREMLKKLESAEADVLGSCPLDKIGAVCSGQGDCKTNTTDPHRTKYCACKAGSGRTGRDCSMCKFGWKMATGDLKGFCKQVYVPTVTFLQTSSSQKYSVEDLNQAVATLMQTGRHQQSSSAIEDLLTALEKTLADKEAMMRKERDDLKITHDKAETTNHAEKKLMEDWEKKKDKAILEEEAQKEIYKAIYDMYWFEHPMRLKETELLNKLDAIMAKLEGGDVSTGTPTVAPTKHTNTQTHTPTTSPTAAAA